MDLAQALRVQNPTRYRSGSRGGTQWGTKEELMTDQASMVEHLHTYHHHGWDYHPEPLFLATSDQLAHLHNQIA
jgi:hypothetical protein